MKDHWAGEPKLDISPDGSKFWTLNGVYHRIDGPAIETMRGETYYWINGKHIPQLQGKHIYGKEKLAKILVLI